MEWLAQLIAFAILGFFIWLGTRAEIAWRRYKAKKTRGETPVVPVPLVLPKPWRITAIVLIVVLCVATFLYGLG